MSELSKFAQRYAKAWCSRDPRRVAAFFAENGSISINNGPPAVGRAAIAREAQAFMTTFPDMVVTMDKVTRDLPDGGRSSCDAVFHWTLTGTNTGPGGTGKRVRMSSSEIRKKALTGTANPVFICTMKTRTLLVSLALCFATGASSFAMNANMGTCKLNVKKSKLGNG